jgi:hypothetical protein
MHNSLLLVFMIDALGYRMVTEAGVFRFLDVPDGPVHSLCGYSSACIPSLFTGKRPVEHGHWAMYLRDPRHSLFGAYRPWIWLFSEVLGRNGFTRRMLSRQVARAGITDYFSLYEIPPRLLPQFDLCAKRDIFSAGAFDGLSTPMDVAEKAGLSYRVWNWRGPEAQRRAELGEALRSARHQMLFFYSPLLDAIGHEHGVGSRQTHDCLRDFEGFVREMLELAGTAYGDVRVFIFGDHGMANVTGVHDLYSEVRALPYRAPRDYLYFIDSTMARFWFFKPGVRAAVERLLRGKRYGRVIEEEECERLGILFPDRRYGETLFLADAGEILAPSFMGTSAPKGMHGYHPEHEDSDTILLTNFPHGPVRSIMDIGPLLGAEIEALAARENAGVSNRSVEGGSGG